MVRKSVINGQIRVFTHPAVQEYSRSLVFVEAPLVWSKVGQQTIMWQ